MILIPLLENSTVFPKSKIQKTLYHGSNNPDLIDFDKDFDYEANNKFGRIRDFELPYGVIFLTDSEKKAKMYGSNVIAANVNVKKVLIIDVGDKSPDRAFDDDYNGEGKMWEKFEDGGYDILEIKGTMFDKPVSIYVTYPELVKAVKK